MKNPILTILFILSALAVMMILCGAGNSDPPYVGSYELDVDGCSVDIGELYMMYGSSLRDYGAGMNIRADGTMDWYIGLTGGEGSYTVDDDTLTATVTSYNGGHTEEQRFTIVNEDGGTHIIYHVRDEAYSKDIRWSKAE